LDDLVLSGKGSVDRITDGLPIKGKGTFKFTIGDDNGRQHNIRIPKSLYVPGMKKCLLSPQIGCRLQLTRRHGWGILMIAAFNFGIEARRPFPSVP
jgi:hypothetical protein